MSNLVTVRSVYAGYGDKEVVRGIDLTVDGGEVVAVIGHNGAGKSTLLKAMFSLIPLTGGQISYDGISEAPLKPRTLLQNGVAYMAQGNRVFRTLTVSENLDVAASVISSVEKRRTGIETALRMFPSLREKLHERAFTLSGGERQMLAFANCLVVGPRLLLLDEPSLGLSPGLVRTALDRIRDVCRDTQTGCLVVEQKVIDVLRIADRVYAMREGRVLHSGPAEELRTDTRKLREVYL